MTDHLTAVEPGSSNSLWDPEEFQTWLTQPDEEMDTGENSLRGVGECTNGGQGSYGFDASRVTQRSGRLHFGAIAQHANTDYGEHHPLDLGTTYLASPASPESRPGVRTLGGAAESSIQITEALRRQQIGHIHRALQAAAGSTRALDVNVHRCPTCRKTYKNARALRRHSRYHDPVQNQHRCEVCGYSSLLPKDLKRHKKTHVDIQNRPFKCREPGCEKSYTRSDNLSRHLQKKHAGIPDSLVSLDPPETHYPPECQAAASEYHSMGSTSVQPDAEADHYQAELCMDLMNLSSYSGYGRSCFLEFEQMTDAIPTVDPQLLHLRNSFSRDEPVDFLRDAPAGVDDDSALTESHVRPRYGFF